MFWRVAVLCFVLLVAGVVTSEDEVRTRDKRADDGPALETIVATLSQRVDQLAADNVQLRARLNALEQPVAFWSRFANADISGLAVGQTLAFDTVLHNAGSAYDVHTGVFTVPTSGTYVFFVRVMTHAGDTDSVYLTLTVNGQALTVAWASGQEFNEGFTTATLHLDAGDKVYVTFGDGHDRSLWGGWHTSFSGFRLAS